MIVKYQCLEKQKKKYKWVNENYEGKALRDFTVDSAWKCAIMSDTGFINLCEHFR